MRYANSPVLVTGAGGFIGSHLVEGLLNEGASVRALVRYTSTGSAGFLDELPSEVRSEIDIVYGDLADEDCVRDSMRGIEVAFHLAALIAIPYSYVHPREYVRTNVMGTLNVLQAARELGTRRVVHTSTSEVYGTAQYVPIDEKHPVVGQSPYSATKIGSDKLAESFWRSFELPVTTVRPFNTYGPRQSPRAVVPTIVVQALAGGTVALGSTTPTRDLTFVSDTVEGFMALARTDEAVGQVVNLGTGSEISISDLAALVFRVAGREAAVVSDQARVRPPESEVERLLSDPTRARELFGWEPKVPLEEGIRRVIEYVEAHLDRYDPARYYL
jgi:NAD dependent epimerase/dehydratase